MRAGQAGAGGGWKDWTGRVVMDWPVCGPTEIKDADISAPRTRFRPSSGRATSEVTVPVAVLLLVALDGDNVSASECTTGTGHYPWLPID